MADLIQDDIITSIDYFPFLRAFWSTDGTYEKLTTSAKAQHIRALWKLLARDQPEIMQMLNKEYSISVMDVLHITESKNAYNPHTRKCRQPGYTYLKAYPKNSKTLDAINAYPKLIREEFRVSNGLDVKEFDFFCDVHPELILEGLEALEKLFNQMKKPKKRKR